MRVRNSIINSFLSILSLVILAVLGFVSTKVFVSTLGIEYNGLNGVFTNILSILAITELGIGGAITYNLYKPIVDKDYDKIASTMKFYRNCYRVVGMIIFVLSLFVSLFIGVFFKDTTLNINYIRFVFLLFAINTSVSYFFSYNRNLFYAYQQNYIIVIIDFICKTLKIIFQILSLILINNYIVFLIINIIFTFASNLIIHISARKYYKNVDIKNAKDDKELNKSVFKSVKDLSIVQLLSTSINFTDNIIISSFINIVNAGLYANYNLLFSQIQRIVISIYNNLGAAIGNLVAEDKKGHTNTILINLEYVSFFLASFCACSFFFITQPFVEIWLGKNYLLSIGVLVMLIISFYILIHQQPINYFLSANGMFKKMIFPLVLQSIINLVLSIVLAIKIGLIGVFIGTVVSSIISWILTAFIIYDKYKIKRVSYLIRQLVFILITLLEMFILKVIFIIYLPKTLLIKVIYIIIWCLIIPNLFSLILIIYNKKIIYLKELFYKIINKVFIKKSFVGGK